MCPPRKKEAVVLFLKPEKQLFACLSKHRIVLVGNLLVDPFGSPAPPCQ